MLREVARDNILECAGKLNGDRAGGRGRDEGNDGGFEVVAVGGGNRDLVGARVRVNEVGRVHAVFKVDCGSLARGTTRFERRVARSVASVVRERVGDAQIKAIVPDDLQYARNHALLSTQLVARELGLSGL